MKHLFGNKNKCMSMNVEYEFKYLCDRKEFDFYLKKLKGRYRYKCTKQENYYFDTDNWDYFYNGVTVRVRNKSGFYKLTVKDKRNYSEKNPLSNEYNINVAEDVVVNLLEIGSLDLADFNLPYIEQHKVLNLKGVLRTNRLVFVINDVECCFDVNEYNGIIDYEIEIEGCLEKIKVFNNYFLAKGLTHNVKGGKYTRFVKSCL